ncbi:MAG: DUF5666 domain-containing protein [Anaerolineae bacterium]
MKKSTYYLVFLVLTLAAYVLSACGGALPAQSAAPAGPATGQKVQAAPVAFLGVVEAMNGDQWVISGQTVVVDPKMAPDPTIKVGDQVRVEGMVGQDGRLVATRIGPVAPAFSASALDAITSTPDPISTPQATATPDTTTAVNEVVGVLEAISDASITVNGQVYLLTPTSEIKDLLAVGDLVIVHYQVAADGSFEVVEVSLSDSMGNDNSNGNSNGNDQNSSGNTNSNVNINDDNQSNSNDHSGNDNTNEDDDSNDSNSNENSNEDD